MNISIPKVPRELVDEMTLEIITNNADIETVVNRVWNRAYSTGFGNALQQFISALDKKNVDKP